MFFETGEKAECFACEACIQICKQDAIQMSEDDEGFRYPVIDLKKCIHCNMCRRICPHGQLSNKFVKDKYVFGGYHLNNEIRFESTSGGAFSAIVDAFCDVNYVIFGATAAGINVFHSYIKDLRLLDRFRKSKYSQSVIGNSYKMVKSFLAEGKKVVFSGTPCQISGLCSFLGKTDQSKLLTIEVVCEGVPSPLYIRKYEDALKKEYGSRIEHLDYRYTGESLFHNGKWDFEIMRTVLSNSSIDLKKDRWFNPFWSIWLNHLMSRPSCYQCEFATIGRVADITLGDLWGVHIYCPELYGKNGGSSLVICNSNKGKKVFEKAKKQMFGHELLFEEAIKYQSPLYKTISNNPNRKSFMKDLKSDMTYQELNNKWAKKPTIKLLFQKYIWGNRQKILWGEVKQKVMGTIWNY